MAYLPSMLRGESIKKETQLRFGGINRSGAFTDGELSFTENISSEGYPELKVRRGHKKLYTAEEPNMLFAAEGKRIWLDGERLFLDGTEAGSLTSGRKSCALMGEELIIFPDKISFNINSLEIKSLEASWQGSAEFCDGSIYGEPAEANTIKLSSPAPFKAGDGISLYHSGISGNDGKTLIIREIGDEGRELRFYEHSFTKGSCDGLALKRELPSLEHICVSGGRLWGTCGRSIYGSALGDPENFNVFDGLSTDSYALDTADGGSFTACTDFLSYPLFFKEQAVHKLYGSKPSNFELLSVKGSGVRAGSEKSLCQWEGRLIYLSAQGFCSYTGGIPALIGEKLSDGREYRDAVSLVYKGSYISSVISDGEREILSMNLKTGEWYREDGSRFIDAAEGCALTEEGDIIALYGEDKSAELPFEIRFCPIYEKSGSKKALSRLVLRYGAGEDSLVELSLSYDGGKSFRAPLRPTMRGESAVFPIVPERADSFVLRIKGRGDFSLKSLVRCCFEGTEL